MTTDCTASMSRTSMPSFFIIMDIWRGSMPAPIPGIMGGARLKSGLNPTAVPMATLTTAEARRLDLNAEELGVPVERLMANAGKALAKVVNRALGNEHKRRFASGESALFLCGKG